MPGCARCGNPMRTVDAGGIELDVCPSCGGTWFDAGELERTLELRQEDLAVLAECGERESGEGKGIVLDQPPAFCPRCSGPLEPQRLDLLSRVMIDLCPRGHGIWLDRGELEEAQDFCRRRDEMLERERRELPLRLARERAAELERVRRNLQKDERDLSRAETLTRIIERILAIAKWIWWC